MGAAHKRAKHIGRRSARQARGGGFDDVTDVRVGESPAQRVNRRGGEHDITDLPQADEENAHQFMLRAGSLAVPLDTVRTNAVLPAQIAG